MQKNIRQLAAIMFTDMVGYTAIMQKDEHKAIKNREHHREVLERLIKEARDLGFSMLRLDTGPFMKKAQKIYRSIGFKEIEPYKQSEVVQNETLEPIRKNWIFMEMLLK